MNRARPGALALALATLFVPLFARQSLGPLDFWTWMTATGIVAVGLARVFDPGLAGALRLGAARIRLRDCAAGALSAVALYVLFAAGAWVLRRIWPASADSIAAVYGLKSGVPTARIVLLLMLVIAPAEEIVWRAALQRMVAERWGAAAGVAGAAALYAAVHLGAGNLPLAAAAGLCGLFWGAMYARWRSLPANIVSHALWDVLVFVIAPLA